MAVKQRITRAEEPPPSRTDTDALERMRPRPKLAPVPFNTPSLKKEYGGIDPDLQLVPEGGPVWGGSKSQQDLETTASAAARANARNERLRAEQALEKAGVFLMREEAARLAAQELAARAALAKERALQAAEEEEEAAEEEEEEEELQGDEQTRDSMLVSEVERINTELQLDAATPLADAIEEANSTMGLEVQGSLAEQVAALLEAMGLEPADGSVRSRYDEWAGGGHSSFLPSQPSLSQIQQEQETDAVAANNPASLLLPPPPQYRMLVRANDNITASCEVDPPAPPLSVASGPILRQADKSIEEREAEYAAARARIMGVPTRTEESGRRAKSKAGPPPRRGKTQAADVEEKRSTGDVKGAIESGGVEAKARASAMKGPATGKVESRDTACLTAEQQRQQLGTQLYARVCSLMDMSTPLCRKVTGMMLEMPIESVLPLVESYSALRATILQALAALGNTGDPLPEKAAHANGSRADTRNESQTAHQGVGKGGKSTSKISAEADKRKERPCGTAGGGSRKEGRPEAGAACAADGSPRGAKVALSPAGKGRTEDGRSEC